MQRHFAIVLLAALCGCRSSSGSEPPPPAPAEPTEPAMPAPDEPAAELADYVFVFLKAGPREQELTEEELVEIQRGHFANMDRLAEERLLLVAGPLGDPRADPADRGIFVFDVPDIERAQELTATDPALVGGALTMEAHAWRTTAKLRRMPDLLEEADEEDTDDEPSMRAYVLAQTSDADAAERALAPLIVQGRVFLHGRLGTRPSSALFVLDATDPDAARAMLEQAAGPNGPELDWTLRIWWATDVLQEVPGA